jgi:hypothetical protein
LPEGYSGERGKLREGEKGREIEVEREKWNSFFTKILNKTHRKV